MRVALACLITKVAAVAAGAGSPSSDLTLGVDLGDASSKLAVVDRRGARVVVNRVGGRSTPSAVVFGLGGRASGEQTSGGLLARSPHLSMTRPRVLLAATGRARDMNGPKILVPDPAGSDAITDEDDAEVAASEYSGDVPQVRLDGPAAVAPLLGHLASTVHHALAEEERAWHGAPAAVVVAVPGGFTHGARRAVANAVKVAQAADSADNAESAGSFDSSTADGGVASGGDWAQDARVALLSDGSAAAFAYGFDRRTELAEEEAANGQRASGGGGGGASKGSHGWCALPRDGRIVLFVDIGHSKTEATAAALRSDGVCILGRAWDGCAGSSRSGTSSSASSSASSSSGVGGLSSSTDDLPVCGASVDALVLQLACEGLVEKHPSWANQLDPTPPRPLYAPAPSTADGASNSNKRQPRRSSDAASGKFSSLLWDEKGFPTRGGARLLEACRRTKVTLSANAAAAIAAERFGPNGEDAKCVIQRADLDALLLASGHSAATTATSPLEPSAAAAEGSLCARAADCCRRALLAAGLSPPTPPPPPPPAPDFTPTEGPVTAATPATAVTTSEEAGAAKPAKVVHSFELLGGGAYVPALRVAVAGVAQEWSEHGLRQTCDPLETVTRGCALHAAALLSDAHRAAPAAGRRRVVAVAPYQLTDCVSRPVRALVRFVVQGDSGSDSNRDKLRSDGSSSGASEGTNSEDVNSASSSIGNDDTDGDNHGDSSSSSSSSGSGVSSSKAIAVTVCRAGATLPSATEVSVPIGSHHRDNLVAIVVDLFEGTELPSNSGGNSGSNGEGGGFLGRFVAHGPKAQPATSLIPRGSSAVESSSLRLRFALRAGDGVATVQAAALEWSTLSKVEKVPVVSNATSTNSSSDSSQSSDSSATTNSSSAEEEVPGKEAPVNDDSTEGAESATTPPPPPSPPRRSSMVLKVTSVGPTAASAAASSQPSTSSPPLPPAIANILAAPSVPPPPYFACPLLTGEALDAAVARERASRRADAAAVSAAKAVNELEASMSVARQELEDFEFDSDCGGGSDSSSSNSDDGSDDGSASADVWSKLAAESVALCSDRNKNAGVELEGEPPPSLAFCLGANGRAALQHAVEDASNFLETSPLERLSTHGLSASLEVVSQGRQHAETLASVLAPATAVQTAAMEWRAEQVALWKALRELEAALGDPPPTVRSTTSSSSSSGTSGSENNSGNSNGHGGPSGRGSISGLFGPKGSSVQPRRPRTESNTAASARQAAAEVRSWLMSAPLKRHPLQAQSWRRRPGEKALNRNEALVAAATAVGGHAQQKRATLEVWSTQLRTSSQAAEGAATLGAQARAAAADVQRTAAGLFGATGKDAGSDSNSSPKNHDNTNR